MSKSEVKQAKLNEEQREDIREALTYFFTYENDFKEMVERLLDKTFDEKTGKLKDLKPQKQKKL